MVRADWRLHSPVERPIAYRVLLKAPLCDSDSGFAIADVEKKVKNGDFAEHPTTHNFPGPYMTHDCSVSDFTHHGLVFSCRIFESLTILSSSLQIERT